MPGKSKHRRIAINALIIVITLTLYDTHETPLLYHEIVGISVFALYAIHVFINRKWKAKPQERAVTLCLGAAFLLTLISGILISHELFPQADKAPQIWLTIHIVSALAALLLSVVHGIQHRKSLLAVFRKRTVLKICCVAVILAITAFLIFHSTQGLLKDGKYNNHGNGNGKSAEQHIGKNGDSR